MKMEQKSGYNTSIIQSIVCDFERFIIDNGELDYKGLYLKDGYVFAVIHELIEAQKLLIIEKYEEYRSLAIPEPIFIDSIPDGSTRIPLSSSWEKVNLHGYPFTLPEAINELNIHIPKKFQPFHFDYKYATNVFELKMRFMPQEEEVKEIEVILAGLGYDAYEIKITVDPLVRNYPRKEKEIDIENKRVANPHNLMLTASSFLSPKLPKTVIDKYESDEQFWVDHRVSLLTNMDLEIKDVIPSSFLGESSCFVDASVFIRNNIREYLSLYKIIIIALPFNDCASKNNDFYSMFSITKFELQELIRRGRLKFVLTQNLKRYSMDLLADIVEVDPDALIFQRRLASSTIVGMRNKSGLLGYSLSTDEQFNFIRALTVSGTDSSRRVASALAKSWNGMEYLLNKLGVTALPNIGIADFLSNLYGSENIRFLGLYSSGYEISLGLGAHYLPPESPENVALNMVESCGAWYSGVKVNQSNIRENELGKLLQNVFTLNNDIDVLELDRIFSGHEIPFASTLLSNYANLSDEELQRRMTLLRTEIGRLESNQSRLSCWDFTGFIGGVGGFLSSEPVVGLLVWAISAAGKYLVRSSDTEVFYKLSALNNRTSRDVVLIHRARKNLDKCIP